MATTTTLMCIGGNYGNSGNGAYTNSAGLSVYIGPSGYQYRSRLLFPSLRAYLGLGTSTIKITAVTLHLRRAEGSTTIRAGCNTSGAWGAAQLGAGSGTIGSSTGWYTINISGVGEYIDDYTGNWYLHLTGSGSRARCNGFNSDWVPRVKVTWEYVANTIKTETDESTAGEPVTFNITPGANDAAYTLTYKFGTATGTIVEKTADTSITWTPPLSLVTEIPNASEGTATITMTVYNASGAVLRTELLYLTINVPETVLPIIPSDGIGIELVKTLGGYPLTGESYANITPKIDMNGAYGATIKTLTATVTDGENVQNIPWASVSEIDAGIFGGATLPTNIFTTAGDAKVMLEVVDSRGRIVTAEATPIPVQAYSRPVITLFGIDRYEPVYDDNEEIAGYVISDVGERVWTNVQAYAHSVAPDGAELNSIRWEIVGAPTTARATGGQYSGTGDGLIINITDDRSIIEDVVSASIAMNYTLTVTDGVGNVAYAYDSVAPGRANFSLAPSKYGAAFGGIAKGMEENPMLESYYPAHFYAGAHGIFNDVICATGANTSVAASASTVPLTSATYAGEVGKLKLENNGVIIGPGVKYVEISGGISLIDGGYSNIVTFVAKKNGSSIVPLANWQVFFRSNLYNYRSMNIGPWLMEVTEGDKITIQIEPGAATTIGYQRLVVKTIG